MPFTDTFTYVISGGGPAQATGIVSITIVTNILYANDDKFSILAESGTNVLDVLANDFILPNTLGGSVSINAAGTRLLYKPEDGLLNSKQEPSFTYTISDGAGGLATATVLIKVQVGGLVLYANDDIFTVMKNSSNTPGVLE